MGKNAKHYYGGIVGADPVVSSTPRTSGVFSLGALGGDGAGVAGDANWSDVVLLLDGTSLTDRSNAGNNVSNAGSVSINQSTTGTGFNVQPKVYDISSSGSQYLYAADGSMDNLGNAAFTIEALVKVANTSTARGIFTTCRPEDTSPTHESGVMIYVTGSGSLAGTINGPDNTVIAHNGGSGNINIEDTYWHHVALVYDGTEYELYLDGVASGSPVTATPNITSNSKVQIGRLYTNYNQFGLNGSITQFRITKGVARYTAGFSNDLPTANFPTNAPVAGDTRPARRWGGMTGRSLTNDVVLPPSTFYYWSQTIANNYASITLSNGGATANSSGGSGRSAFGDLVVTTGKWYYEVLGDNNSFGWSTEDESHRVRYSGGGSVTYTDASGSTTYSNYSAYSTTSVIGCAWDADAGVATFFKDGTQEGSFSGGSAGQPMRAKYNGTSGVSRSAIINAGQDHTFDGSKTALTTPYTDANGFGEFYHPVPAGYAGLYTATTATSVPTTGVLSLAEHYQGTL